MLNYMKKRPQRDQGLFIVSAIFESGIVGGKDKTVAFQSVCQQTLRRTFTTSKVLSDILAGDCSGYCLWCKPLIGY